VLDLPSVADLVFQPANEHEFAEHHRVKRGLPLWLERARVFSYGKSQSSNSASWRSASTSARACRSERQDKFIGAPLVALHGPKVPLASPYFYNSHCTLLTHADELMRYFPLAASILASLRLKLVG
jgi:hypothetical protein